MLYTKNTSAMYYDCDINNNLKMSAAMQYMQQTSSEQMELAGIAPGKLMAENMVFLLSQSALIVNRMPQAAEKINITTAATAYRGARFVREFAIETPGGEQLVSSSTLWILVNPASRRIIRPADFPYAIELEKSFVPEELADISFPKSPEALADRELLIPVRYSQLDCNRHINNGIYADFVCDVLDYDELDSRGIQSLTIKFQNEAKHGDSLKISRYTIKTGEYYIEGSHERAGCFQALVNLK